MTSKCKHYEVCARCSATGHKDDTCTKVHKCFNCEENHASYKKNAVFINESMILSILVYHRMYLFLKLVQFIKKTHGQRVMNYAGTTKAPSSAHQYVHRLICRGLGPSLLHISSVRLLLLLSDRFHPFTVSGHFFFCMDECVCVFVSVFYFK